MSEWTRAEGSPTPLGATWISSENAYNFALYSRHATGVTLLVFGRQDLGAPMQSYRFDAIRNKTGRVWHLRVPAADIEDARYYAYRVEGPNDPANGHRFDPEKVLLDPYARGVFFPPGHDRGAAARPGSNLGKGPLGLLPHADRAPAAKPMRRPTRHGHDLVIYEVHVRGFTKHPSSGLDDRTRGTFAGLTAKIPYLKDLGVTAVELLPVHQFDPKEGGYWGYSTLSFFSPHHVYSRDADAEQAALEFRDMVQQLHDADIEVILDVVYNHTTEGNEHGPNYCYRGIDNSSYYLLDRNFNYSDKSGCGNDMRSAYAPVRRLVVDSLRYWASEMGVDGFRFDLASIFMRGDDGSLNFEDPPIVAEIGGDPVLGSHRLIAEPWDAGGTYVLGRQFPGQNWLQWNDRFRDDMRRFVKGDNGCVNAAMQRLYGSDDLFSDRPDQACHAYQSVNFLTCHDGFCLYDLVSYNEKHNEANGENNRDGHDPNFSWNCGWEGDDNLPPDVLALRNRQIKNFCCLLMLSNGTPMFVAGDEFMNTQRGNNNPYNQDNETTWLDWTRLQTNQDVFRFFKYMIAFRKAHPSLGRSRFWRDDVGWHGVVAEPDRADASHSLAVYLRGSQIGDADIYVMINAYWQPLDFAVQEGSGWRRAIDTGLDSPHDIVDSAGALPLAGNRYEVGPRSVAVLIR